jgi:PAS domain S-box-containing protein
MQVFLQSLTDTGLITDLVSFFAPVAVGAFTTLVVLRKINSKRSTSAAAALEELRRSRDQLQIILQGVADGITVQDKNGLIFANDRAARLTGFLSAEALMKSTGEEILSKFEVFDESGKRIGLGDLPGRKVLESGKPHEATLRYRIVESGEELWSKVKSTPVLDLEGNVQFAINIFRNITDRKRREITQKFLSEVSELLVSSLDHTSILQDLTKLSTAYLCDSSSVHLYDEQGTLREVAVSQKEDLESETKSLWSEVEKALELKKVQVINYRSESRTVSALLAPLLARGRTLGLMTFVSTTRTFSSTDLSLAEELARRSAIVLDNLRLFRETEQANLAKDHFLATLSHELRTPLNAMLGWSKVLLTRQLDPQTTQKALQTIERNAGLQLSLIEDLLDVTRIVSGKLQLNLQPVNLFQLIHDAVASSLPSAETRKVEMKLILSSSDLEVNGDPSRIRQVIHNLISNAIKFTPPGGNIQLSLEEEGPFARLTVRDDGIGINPEFLPQVFEKFRQADSSITRSHGGLGLGLAIVRHIVEAHGGRVIAESEGEGKGAAFSLLLPLAK